MNQIGVSSGEHSGATRQRVLGLLAKLVTTDWRRDRTAANTASSVDAWREVEVG